MSDQKKNWFPGGPPEFAPARTVEQRRASRIVHDERGNARVEWVDDAAGKLLDERVPLAIVEDGPAGTRATVWDPRKAERGWNPYQPVAAPRTAAPEQKSGGRTDLRKLSEWIKLKRELEARKNLPDDAE